MPVSTIWNNVTASSRGGSAHNDTARLIGPDRHPAGADGVQQAAGPVGLGPGVGAAFAVQHHQQRPRRAVLVVGGEGGGVPAGPGADHQVRLPAARTRR